MRRLKPTLIERGLALVAPRAALRHFQGRMQFAAASGYEGARRDRPGTRNFAVLPGTADQATLPQLHDMRERSRDMVRNQPLASGAISTVVTNVVGTGLRLSAQVDRDALSDLLGLTPDEASVFERRAEREWRLFCRREVCDVTGRNSFAGMQELAFRSVLESGDAFVAMAQSSAGPFDFGLQLIEADRVSNPNRTSDTETLAGGVELNSAGRPVAFHVADMARMTGQQTRWRRYAAYGPDGRPRMLHLLHQQRIDQSRGVPYLAPVIATLTQLSKLTEAEVTAAVLNACIAVTTRSDAAQSPLAMEAAAAGNGQAGASLRRADITFEPGMVLEGWAPGEEIQSFSSDRPSSNFDPFMLAVLRQVGVALELPFELLVKHFTASYSAARAALLQAWGFFRARRSWLADGFCQPVYEAVLENAIRRGRLVAPGFLENEMLRMAWCGSRWTGPSAGQIDPLKEVNAAEKRLGLMLSTRTRETAELTGDDWEAVAAEARTELDLIEELDLAPEPPADAPADDPEQPMDQPEAA